MDEAVFFSWVNSGMGGMLNILERAREEGRLPPDHHLGELAANAHRLNALVEHWMESE